MAAVTSTGWQRVLTAHLDFFNNVHFCSEWLYPAPRDLPAGSAGVKAWASGPGQSQAQAAQVHLQWNENMNVKKMGKEL